MCKVSGVLGFRVTLSSNQISELVAPYMPSKSSMFSAAPSEPDICHNECVLLNSPIYYKIPLNSCSLPFATSRPYIYVLIYLYNYIYI